MNDLFVLAGGLFLFVLTMSFVWAIRNRDKKGVLILLSMISFLLAVLFGWIHFFGFGEGG